MPALWQAVSLSEPVAQAQVEQALGPGTFESVPAKSHHESCCDHQGLEKRRGQEAETQEGQRYHGQRAAAAGIRMGWEASAVRRAVTQYRPKSFRVRRLAQNAHGDSAGVQGLVRVSYSHLRLLICQQGSGRREFQMCQRRIGSGGSGTGRSSCRVCPGRCEVSRGTNVRGLGIWTSGTLKTCRAHLTSVFVKSLEVGAQFGVSDDAANGSPCARGYQVPSG